jgi:NAD(P)-dependent dehydrogenase (short-subunit alcohol dehydrogenase family)
MAEFSGKTVMITGASGNVGRALAHKFGAHSANLVLIDRDVERLNAFQDELKRAYGVQTHPVMVDANNAADVDAMIAGVSARFGQIDVLAHTIGGFASGDPVYDMNMDVFEQQIDLNVRPIYTLVGRVVKHMLDRGVKGNVVIVLARAALKGAARSSAYNASKAAAQSLMQSLALEVRDHGINVNAVLPSIIDTPRNRQDIPDADYSKWVTVENIADAIYFLSTDAAAPMHGVSLEVYGRA